MQDVCLPLEQGLLCLDNRKAVFEATLCGVRDNRGFRKKYATAWADYEWFCCAISPHGGVLCHPGLWLAKQGTICALVMSSQNQLTQVWYYLTLCGDGGRLCYIRVGMGKGMEHSEMTLRPLRPSHSTARVEEPENDSAASSVERKLGPIVTPTVLLRTKPATVCQPCCPLPPPFVVDNSLCRHMIHPAENLLISVSYSVLSAECARGRECSYPTARKQAAATPVSPSNSDRALPTNDREISAQRTTPVTIRGSPLSPRLGANTDNEKPSETILLDDATVTRCLEDYFEHLYPLPFFAFLHKPTVTRRCRDGTVNEPLKFASKETAAQQLCLRCHVAAPPAYNTSPPLGKEGGAAHSPAHRAPIYLSFTGSTPYHPLPNRKRRVPYCFSRTAVALRLNYERAELAFVAQEARRRLFWALYILDDYFCVGLREFELLPEETIYLQLSCREEIFEAGEPCQTGMLRPSASDNVAAMGLRGAYLRLISTRRAIMRFNRRVGLGEESPSAIGHRIHRFEQDLACLQAALSPEHQYSISNLSSCAWPAQYVMLHVSYYQCHCDLYRMFLNGYTEAAPSIFLASIRHQDCIAMQAKCLEHAENIIRILGDFVAGHTRDSPNSSQLLLLERDAAVCAFESARLVMFGARLPCATSTLEDSIYKARGISLYFITEFFQYSASTRPLIVALETLISSYSKRLVRQAQPDTRIQGAHTELEPELEPAAPRSSNISRQASSRQRLSVQSLLLQSDFADDSHEIAGPSSGSNVIAATNPPRITYPLLLPTRTNPPQSLGRTTEGSMSISASDPAPPVLPTNGVSGTRDFGLGTLTPPLCVYNTVSQPLQTQLPLQAQTSRSMSSPWSVAIDARREDAGLIFNPWMGFTGTEELYGLSQELSEEY
ncbi:hypothetical protein NPX13_g5634 [Xylaria arbuscula]|uniref:Xylanolytic transcriptional activator regulatory domain-containing protein n=1 Tax=Xylaria arbuscula TaxID=114810 RepID=A0A9W8NDC4_9PEZI|nr:hypothetical protein NPX13_g5634 [Xylaria arbuscula]